MKERELKERERNVELIEAEAEPKAPGVDNPQHKVSLRERKKSKR